MIKLFAPIVLLACLFLSACKDSGPRDDVADIRTTYADYVSALQAGDGTRAAALADSNTVAYYERMLALARTADSASVTRLNVMDRITVLGLRWNAGGGDLGTMDARGAIAAGAATGVMGGKELGSLELGTVTVEGNSASAPVRLGGFPVPAKFHFNKEGEEWKVDITPLFKISRMAFEQMALRSGTPTNEWLIDMLEQSTGERPTNSIWHPAR